MRAVNLSVLKAWWEKAKTPAAICLGQRLALFVVVYLGLAIDKGVMAFTPRPFPRNLLLDGWFRWDAEHYANIAQHGYQLVPNSVQQPTNFWPGYPLLVRIVQVFVGDTFIAGLLVSNLALLGACVLLHRWVCRRYDRGVATRTVTLLVCSPFAFYFSAMYTESVFLLAAVGALYFAQRERWLLASCAAAMAGATRLVGVVVFLAVVLSYAERHRWRLSEMRWNALWLLVGLAGTFGYVAFLEYRFADGFAFLRTQWVPGWGDHSNWPRLALLLGHVINWRRWALGNIDFIALINLVFACLTVVLCLVGFRRVGIAAGAWAVVTMLISLRIWASAGRYGAVIWPAFLTAALLTKRRPQLYQGVVIALCLLQAFLAFWFSHDHWVA
jgi:hypothetical protein